MIEAGAMYVDESAVRDEAEGLTPVPPTSPLSEGPEEAEVIEAKRPRKINGKGKERAPSTVQTGGRTATASPVKGRGKSIKGASMGIPPKPDDFVDLLTPGILGELLSSNVSPCDLR